MLYYVKLDSNSYFIRLVVWILAFTIIQQSCPMCMADELEIVALQNDNGSNLGYGAAISAREIYYGDVLYFVTFESNRSTRDIDLHVDLDLEQIKRAYLATNVTIRYGELVKRHIFEFYYFVPLPYEFLPESRHDPEGHYSVDCARLPRTIPAGKRGFFLSTPIDLPALDEWNDPFWNTIRNDLSQHESVVVNMEVRYKRLNSENDLHYHDETVKFDLTIKNRKPEEMDLLDQWYDNLITKAKEVERKTENGQYAYLPYVTTQTDPVVKLFQYRNAHKEKEKLEVDESAYPFFKEGATLPRLIRPGNRKPPVTDLPHNDQEWETIENVFSPSSLKDEIHLSRALAAIFSSEDDEQRDLQLNSYFSWLDSIPLLERFAFLSWLVDEGTRVRLWGEFAARYDEREKSIYENDLKADWLYRHYSEGRDQQLDFSDWRNFGKKTEENR